MKINRLLSAIVASMLFLLQPLAAAGSDSHSPLLEKVQAAIESHPKMDMIHVKADVIDDQVILRGEVDKAKLADEVSLAVAKVPGVNVIVNEIKKPANM